MFNSKCLYICLIYLKYLHKTFPGVVGVENFKKSYYIKYNTKLYTYYIHKTVMIKLNYLLKLEKIDKVIHIKYTKLLDLMNVFSVA